MLLQQVRQVLTAPPAIQSRPGTGGKTRHGSDGLPRTPKSQSLRSPEKTQPPNPSAEAYLPTSGGPGGLTCGDMALAGEKQASVPCRPSMAARGGRVGMGPPGCQSGGEPLRERGGRRGPDAERGCVCFYRGASFSFLGAVATGNWQHPFFGKISAEPCARHDGLPLLRGCPPVGFMNEPPLPPRAPAGYPIDLLCHTLHYRFYWAYTTIWAGASIFS